MTYLLSKLIPTAFAETFTIPKVINCEDLGCVADKLIGGVYWIAVIVTPFMVLWGGFQVMTAAGDPTKLKNGRDTILWAAIGFLVALLASGFVDFIQSIFK